MYFSSYECIGDTPVDKEPIKYRESEGNLKWNISRSTQYYQIYLDKFKCKSLYKDDMYIPTYPLAVALAEEWAMQPSKI